MSCPAGLQYSPACGSCVPAPLPQGNCPALVNGEYNSCGQCVCPSGTELCGARNICVSQAVCPAGTNFDPCSGACSTPYVLKDTPTAQAGSIHLTGNLKSSGGDLYLNSGKAVRVDSAGTTVLNFGNWGAGTTGTLTDQGLTIAVPDRGVSAHLFGDLILHPSAKGDTFGRLTVPELCLAGDCRREWPALGGGPISWSQLTDFPMACLGGQYVSFVGGTLTCSTPSFPESIRGAGTSGKLPKFASAQTLGDSLLSEDAVNGRLTVSGNLTVTGNQIQIEKQLNIGRDRISLESFPNAAFPQFSWGELSVSWPQFFINSGGDLQFRLDADEANSPQVSTLKVNNGANQTVLQLLENGNLVLKGTLQAGASNTPVIDATGRIPALTPAYFTDLSGAELTNLNASNLNTGVLAPERLPGHLTLSQSPNGVLPAQGTLVVNPPSAVAESTLLYGGVGNTQRFKLDAEGDLTAGGSLEIRGSIRAGSGGVTIVDETGKIPALTSTYLANLSGAFLTNLNASQIVSGTLNNARLPSAPAFSGNVGVGGNLSVGSALSVSGNLTVKNKTPLAKEGRHFTKRECTTGTECSVSCQGGDVLLSGGCLTVQNTVRATYPLSDLGFPNSWRCVTSAAASASNKTTAYAICGTSVNE